MTRWPPSNILETWWWCRCPGVCRPLVLALRPPPVRAGEGHHEALPGQSFCKCMAKIDKTGENVYCLYLQAYHWHISYIKGLTLTLWELCNPHSKHVIHFGILHEYRMLTLLLQCFIIKLVIFLQKGNIKVIKHKQVHLTLKISLWKSFAWHLKWLWKLDFCGPKNCLTIKWIKGAQSDERKIYIIHKSMLYNVVCC